MATKEATARSAIDAEVTVTNLQDIRCCTATGALSTTMP